MPLTVCTAEQRAEGHPLRRPAAPARGATAQPEPRHRLLRVRQHQGSCQVTHGPATAPPGAEEPAPGEETERSLKGTRKKKCICLRSAAGPRSASEPQSSPNSFPSRWLCHAGGGSVPELPCPGLQQPPRGPAATSSAGSGPHAGQLCLVQALWCRWLREDFVHTKLCQNRPLELALLGRSMICVVPEPVLIKAC